MTDPPRLPWRYRRTRPHGVRLVWADEVAIPARIQWGGIDHQGFATWLVDVVSDHPTDEETRLECDKLPGRTSVVVRLIPTGAEDQ